MLADPSVDLVRLVRSAGDRSPTDAERQEAALIRRRFGLSLCPPYAEGATDPAELPVRSPTAEDAPAIGGVKWRSWRAAYGGLFPAVLDLLDIHPPLGYWVGRAVLPPSNRHITRVVGPPGEVYGMIDGRPSTDADADPDRVALVQALYLDPTVWRHGVGSRLLAAAVDHFRSVGFAEASLWVLRDNAAGRSFYEHEGWRPDGATQTERYDALDADFHEVRYRLVL